MLTVKVTRAGKTIMAVEVPAMPDQLAFARALARKFSGYYENALVEIL